jgi:hypothetical protein
LLLLHPEPFVSTYADGVFWHSLVNLCTLQPTNPPAIQPTKQPNHQTLPKSLGPKPRRHLESLFDWLLPACLKLVRRRVREMSPTQDAAIARAAMRIVGALVGAPKVAPAGGIGGGGGGGREEGADGETAEMGGGGEGGVGGLLTGLGDVATVGRLLESAVVFGLVWGVGGSADAQGRREFDGFLRCVSCFALGLMVRMLLECT